MTTTVNYSWTLPTVGASVNTWGTLVNNILTDIDAKMVSKTATQTLTNKTLDAPVITGGASISGNVSVAGGVSATGAISGSTAGVRLPTASPVYFNAGFTTYIQEVSAGVLQFVVGGTDVTHFSSTGLAVTGGLSANNGAANGTLTLGNATFYGTITHDAATTGAMIYDITSASGGGHRFRRGGSDLASIDASGNLNMTAGGHIGRAATASGIFFNTNSVLPSTGTGATDNTVSVGSASYRWTTIYATTGAINTSDARAKTKVRTLADAEVEAAKAFSKEIGIFQWLDSVAKKGDKARKHVGFTVQRAIEIMEANGLDPMAYAFICHDVWADEFKEHPQIAAVEDKAAVLDEDGNVIEPAVEAVEGKDAWTEQTQTAGDRYAFRYDQLNLFIARGLEARLAALESA